MFELHTVTLQEADTKTQELRGAETFLFHIKYSRIVSELHLIICRNTLSLQGADMCILWNLSVHLIVERFII